MVSLTLIFNAGLEEQLSAVALSLTGFFILYEVVQLVVRKLDYFTDLTNWVDIARFGLIIYCINNLNSKETSSNKDIYAVMFGLLWFKLVKYL